MTQRTTPGAHNLVHKLHVVAVPEVFDIMHSDPHEDEGAKKRPGDQGKRPRGVATTRGNHENQAKPNK